MTNNSKELEDILVELMSDGNLSEEEVAKALASSPQHAAAILAFYADWNSDEDGREVEFEDVLTPKTSLHGLWLEKTATPDPFSGQSPAVLKRVAERCEVPMSIINKLIERNLRATTIPLLLLRKLANELKTSAANILEYLEQDQHVTASDFRSDTNPTLGDKVSFSDAIRSATMPDEAKKMWLSLSEE